jgi:hypothetical protein
MSPYSQLEDYRFHNRIFTGQAPSAFDPIVNPRFHLGGDAGIVTMGSCFAQHLSKWLLANGCNLLVEEGDAYGGGVFFSGNYGNVYTVAQALQLLQRAFGVWEASDELYSNSEGRFLDPLRPSVMPEGLETRQQVLLDRKVHEQAVKRLICNADVIVFTLGLTEAWVRVSDEAVLPIAPGVVAGHYSERDYRFINYSYDQNVAALDDFIALVRHVNPKCKIMLTVSPVPLAATYENKHVSLASSASKAVLRAVVESKLTKDKDVDYFPSYEIFYTPGIGSPYFEPDGRHVKQWGVDHAMRLFSRHYIESSVVDRREIKHADSALVSACYRSVICDEDQIG